MTHRKIDHSILSHKPDKFVHLNIKGDYIKVNSLSPIVVMKKLKLTTLNSTFLPELHEEDERDELIQEAQEPRREEEERQSAEGELTFIHTMSNEELNAHIQKCLEMSSENKISQKNAFALQLIDCMGILLEKKDFSTMACTLDAGAKIYSCRVDALHQQVIRLAEEVVQHRRQKENGEKEGDERKKKERRKSNKKNILATSESLRRKWKGKDPKDGFLKVDALPGEIITRVRRDQKDLSFSLENSLPFWPNWEGDYKPLRAEGTVTLPVHKVFRSKPKVTRDWNDNVKIVESVSIAEEAFQDNDDDVDVDEAVTESNGVMTNPSSPEVEVISTAMKRLNEEAGAGAATRFEAMKVVFDEHSDYHYLDMRNAHYWAGPEFWKRPRPGNPVKEKQTRGRKKKQPGEISYDYDAESLDTKWNQLFKRGTTLKKSTITGWKSNKLTLPNDLKVDISLFFDLFHIKAYNGSEEKVESELDNEEDDTECEEMQNSPDNLDCSFYDGGPENSQGSHDSRDPLNSAFYDVGLLHRPEDSGKVIKVQITSEAGETTMVPAPKMVTYEPIKYSTRPIRVDMQHLKSTMMEVITEQVEGATSSSGTTLKRILRSLPARLERRTAQDLSPAMAFLALLTLANENNLQLKNTEDVDVWVNLEYN